MSWISDTFAGLKRIMQLDSDVEQLKRGVEKIDAIAMTMRRGW